MKRIKLFENFSINDYLWPEYRFWIDQLYPEELFFLAIHSAIIEKEGKRSGTKAFFPVEIDSPNDTLEFESDSWREDEGEQNFEVYLNILSSVEDPFYISFDANATCYFTPYFSGDYYNPPEGGEPILNDVNVENLYILDPVKDTEFFLEGKDYKYQSPFINLQNLSNAAAYLSIDFLSFDDDKSGIKLQEIPKGLLDKCEEIRKTKSELTKGYNIMGRFSS